MIEYELTYLAKSLLDDLAQYPYKEYVDVYIPAQASHPVLRLRKRGDAKELTKKTMLSGTDSSEMREETIMLDEAEYRALSQASGKRVRKLRYDCQIAGRHAEVDVFQDELEGLVLIDFEFASSEEKKAFTMPDICLAEVTQEAFLAGGALAGKSYADIAADLSRYGYKKL